MDLPMAAVAAGRPGASPVETLEVCGSPGVGGKFCWDDTETGRWW